jgi:uncharacterized protein
VEALQLLGHRVSGRRQGQVRRLFHYPVKGLSPQPLERVTLASGCGFPFDRVFALARADSGLDPGNPRPLPKQRFFMLARDARLAELRTHVDPGTCQFSVHAGGDLVHESNLSSPAGWAEAVDFFVAMFDLPPELRPMLVRGDPHRFTDVSVSSPQMMNAISLINLASVEDLARRIGQPVDPLRFRANLYFDGFPAFSELDMLERELQIGAARVRILRRTQRCAATEVNLATAVRDLPVPRLLKEHYGHADMGVYAEVLSGGEVAIGDPVAA